ncbi:MAG: lactate racemase domain-containing protein, partial [Desulfovibrionales bacterium]|nr:lactate racemase domain-containing protein [Desulfovibrionales bacterium]
MKIDVPYDKSSSMSAEISDDIRVNFLEANDVEITDEAAILKDAIDNPINSKGFSEFLGDAKKVLVIVNDATRPTPTSRVVDVLFDDLKKTDFNFIIAT